MSRSLAAAVLFVAAVGCHLRAQVPVALPALGDEGEVAVYLQPLPASARRLSLSLDAVRLWGAAGDVPLQLSLHQVSGLDAPGQRLLAFGRVPSGRYQGLSLQLARATVETSGQRADLLVPKEPLRVDAHFELGRGRAIVVQLSVRPDITPEWQLEAGQSFSAVALAPTATVFQAAAFCSNTAQANLTAFDRHTGLVTSLWPTGAEPRGLALDARGGRAYVSLAGEDQIEVIDLSTGLDLRRISLRTGDAPGELALTPDGKYLIVVNQRSFSVAFVDTDAFVEEARVQVGDEPGALLLDRSGRRAYVLNRSSSNFHVLDVGNRGVAAVVSTEPEPLRAQLDRAGDRLYVIHRGSAYMTVFAVPALTVVSRVYVGLGASALKVDPRTDRVYVGRGDEARLLVFDALTLMQVDVVEVPAPVSYLAIDDVENTLLALMPAPRAVAAVDLTSKRIRAVIEVGHEPYLVAPMGERH